MTVRRLISWSSGGLIKLAPGSLVVKGPVECCHLEWFMDAAGVDHFLLVFDGDEAPDAAGAVDMTRARYHLPLAAGALGASREWTTPKPFHNGMRLLVTTDMDSFTAPANAIGRAYVDYFAGISGQERPR